MPVTFDYASIPEDVECDDRAGDAQWLTELRPRVANRSALAKAIDEVGDKRLLLGCSAPRGDPANHSQHGGE
jgi:hypothetical protein